MFSDLYRYREREKKQNLEDWLTECLAAVLRSLPIPCLAKVLSHITGQPYEVIQEKLAVVSIVTQKRVQRGIEARDWQRPDLLIYLGAEPWLLFENKVSHSVEESDDGPLETQLHRYGAWLQSQPFHVSGLRRALVFVTHDTPIPPDFGRPDSRHPSYSGLGRHCSTWGHLARLLNDATKDLSSLLHARALVEAFKSYLEEQGMANEYPEYKDLAGLSLYVEKGDSFCKLVNGMIERLRELTPYSGNVVWADFDSDEGTFAAHRYLKAEKRFDGDTFVATGLWFPDLAHDWYSEEILATTGVPVSPSPKVYLQLANPETGGLAKLEGSPGQRWHRVDSDFIVFEDFAAFPIDPTERAIAIFAWVDAKAAELKRLLS